MTSHVIVLLFLVSLLAPGYIEQLNSSDHKWGYQIGNVLKLILLAGTFIWSLLHPVLVWRATKPQWTRNLGWMLFGLIPVLFYVAAFLWVFLGTPMWL